MPAYWIAHAKVNDPVEYKKYTDPLPAIFKSSNARILARGGRYEVKEGTETAARHVVIEFPDFDTAVKCFEGIQGRRRAQAAQRRGRRPDPDRGRRGRDEVTGMAR